MRMRVTVSTRRVARSTRTIGAESGNAGTWIFEPFAAGAIRTGGVAR